jgi:hypothetical protein
MAKNPNTKIRGNKIVGKKTSNTKTRNTKTVGKKTSNTKTSDPNTVGNKTSNVEIVCEKHTNSIKTAKVVVKKNLLRRFLDWITNNNSSNAQAEEIVETDEADEVVKADYQAIETDEADNEADDEADDEAEEADEADEANADEISAETMTVEAFAEAHRKLDEEYELRKSAIPFFKFVSTTKETEIFGFFNESTDTYLVSAGEAMQADYRIECYGMDMPRRAINEQTGEETEFNEFIYFIFDKYLNKIKRVDFGVSGPRTYNLHLLGPAGSLLFNDDGTYRIIEEIFPYFDINCGRNNVGYGDSDCDESDSDGDYWDQQSQVDPNNYTNHGP